MMALVLLPVAAIGHVAGLKVHTAILENDILFKRITGSALIVVSVPGLLSIWNQSVPMLYHESGFLSTICFACN